MSPTNGKTVRLITDQSIDDKALRNLDDRTKRNVGFFKDKSTGKIVKRGELDLESKLES
jgi:hypothetical protein